MNWGRQDLSGLGQAYEKPGMGGARHTTAEGRGTRIPRVLLGLVGKQCRTRTG